MNSPRFLPGGELSRRFYELGVRPVLQREFPRLKYSAGLLGDGSEVLGFDTPRSRDHNWGPRCKLFLSERDYSALRRRIDRALGVSLPLEVCGYPTNWRTEGAERTQFPHRVTHGPVSHRADISTVRRFFRRPVAVDLTRPLAPADWLVVPQHELGELTGGAVFHDGLGTLEPLRRRLRWYPDQVWRYVLAAQWARIGQEEPFPGRTQQVGDELGSRVLMARLVRDVMWLCFLMERRWAPYSKWFGTAFSRLRCARRMGPVLLAALAAGGWKERERHMSRAYEHAARMHNALGLTRPLPTKVSLFHTRPFLVIHADVFADALQATIRDPRVRALPKFAGSVDTFSDCTDVMDRPELCRKLKVLYR
ncbi:MAG: DUF4037 domain-containing protein [Candidatus Coatesbacteria bacterium]